MLEVLKEWWGFFAFVGTGLFGWMIGVERNRWKINDLGDSMHRLEDRVEKLESQGSDERETLGTIKAHIEIILKTLVRLENRIDDKRDK